jgi:glutamyl/glutaminyl-tRNA synthetase
LLAATHVQRLLQALLGLPEPVYLHHPLVVDEHGRRLAKRHDALAIATLREAGLSPAAVFAMLPQDMETPMAGLRAKNGGGPNARATGGPGILPET